MIDVAIFLCLVPILGISIFIVYRGGIGQVFCNPIVLSNVFFILIHVALPYIQFKEGFFRYQDEYHEDIYIFSMIFSLSLHVLYMTAYLIFFRGRVQFQNIEYRNNHLDSFLWVVLKIGLFTLFIGGYFSYGNLSAILSMGLDAYMRDRISLGVGNGLSILLSHWIYISALIFYFIRLKVVQDLKLKRYATLLFIISMILTLVYYGVNSNRNSLFVFLLFLLGIRLIFSSDLNSKLSNKQLKVTAILVLILIFVSLGFSQLGKLRHDIASSNVSESYGLVNALNGAFGNHENIVWLFSNDFDLLLGKTYFAGMANFVPRAIWKDKPLGAGPRLKNSIYPGSYVVGQEGNSSLTTGLYTEAYMNFGFFGSYMFVCFLVFLMSIIYSLMLSSRLISSKLLYAITLVSFSTLFLYAEFLGFFSRYIFTIIPILLIIAFERRWRLKYNEANFAEY